MAITLFCLIVVVLFAFGFPVAISFMMASLGYVVASGGNCVIILKQSVSGVNSFVYLAVPLFILAAQVMNASSISQRLFDFCNKLVGHIPGGLGHVNVVSSIIFSGMSGSALADTSGIGFLAYDSMQKRGFDKSFSAALTIASASIGPIIPPSITMVIYAVIANASVGSLFLGGVLPGLLLGGTLMAYCVIADRIYHFPREKKATPSELASSFLNALLPLLTPVILIGGIYSGAFTPTEASAVAAFYAILLGLWYNRGREGLRALVKVARETVRLTGMTMFIVATASVFSWVITKENIPQHLTAWVLEMNMSKEVFLVVVNLIILGLGCAIDINTILLVFVPIVIPIAIRLGVDLVHFGVIITLGLMIGMLTPPFGMQLFLISGLTKIPIKKIVISLWPMLVCTLITLAAITAYSPLVLWLPSLLK